MPLTGEYEPSPSERVRMQVETYEKTDGAEGGDLVGVPVVIVTTIGRKTGTLRKTPLMRVEREGSYAAVASQGGAPTHPVWYWSMKANPHVEVRDMDRVGDDTARERSGSERDQWWDRTIPVFVLEPRH